MIRVPRYLILSVVLLSVGAQAAAPTPPGLMVLTPKPAPALKLKDMDGKTVDLQRLRGRWVLVHFWASWCGPCRQEMPTLQAMRAQIPEERLALLMVNTAETDEQVFAFLPTVAPDLNSYMDYDGAVTDRWQPRGLPSSFFVDPTGRLRYLVLGGRAWDSPVYLNFLRSLPRQ